jgi:hypothetical protein
VQDTYFKEYPALAVAPLGFTSKIIVGHLGEPRRFCYGGPTISSASVH